MQTLGKSALRKKLIYELYLMVQQHQFVSNPFIQQKQSIDRHRRQAEIQKASQRYRRRQTLILESLTLPESKETEEVDDSSDSDDELSTAIVDRAQTTASTTLCTALSLWYENRMKKLRRVANSTHEISLVLNEYYDNLIHVILKKQLNDLSSTLFSTFLHCSLYHGIEENYDESITELIERTSLLSHVNNFIIDRFLQKQCDDNNLIRTNNEFRQHLTMLACWINASDESRANLCTTIYYRNRKMDKMRRKQSPQFSESYDEYCKKSMMNLHSNSTFFNATTLTYSNFSLYHNKNMKLTKLSDRVFNQETPRIKYVTKSDMDISRSEGYCQVLNNYRRQHRTNIRRHIDDHIYIYLFKYVNSPTTTTSTTTTTTTTITSISEQNEMKIPIGVIEWMNSSIGVFANLMIPFRSLTNFEEETSYIANIDIVNDNDHRHV
ncbi:hypothetical protein SNEBB_001295 [Seison nebaliae]|nr:hypothetical protein SNEBB_001295 [Seison nebaliae]